MLESIPNQLSTNLNQQTNIAILILAAGNSTRMGEPKQLLKWKNSTLLGHAIQTTTKIPNTKTHVVLGANFDLIKTEIKNAKIIYNLNWESGLGSSIAEGVKYLISTKINYKGVLVMLGDQPLVNSNYLKSLIDAFEVGKKRIVASEYGNNKLGVPALFDNIYFEELSQLNEDKGAQTIIKKNIDYVLTFQASHLISDIDTKEDYKKIYKVNHQ